MVFNSLTFLVFFAIVLALHSLRLPGWIRKTQLLLASYIFYAAWNPPLVLLLWISTLADWYAARGIGNATTPGGRRLWLFVSLGVNLGLLGFFKYGDFVLFNFQALLGSFGIVYAPLAMNIVLPVGISFYTFQTLSYTLDVYRGQLRPWPSFLDYALYVTFFPQLVAGPIVRATEFLPQCDPMPRASLRQFTWGMHLLILGLFQKITLADTLLAPISDAVFQQTGQAGFVDGWIGTMAFAGQIFFDFSGYSTCAIGAALCLGFVLIENFHRPYAALGFSDFWRRWHISLSTWLRDYLYIALGGNRHGRWRTYANLMITMFLGGLWHGASWRFVAWGSLHGLYLVVERILTSWCGTWPVWQRPAVRGILWLGTFLLVCVTWVFFRADSFGAAFTLILGMFGMQDAGGLLSGLQRSIGLGVVAALLGFHLLLRDTTLAEAYARLPRAVPALLVAVLLVVLFFTPGDDRAFIYFQF